MNSVTDEKALKEWNAVNKAYSDYLNKAMFGESIEEAEAAKRALDNARKRYARAMKDIDPEISKAFNSGTFGNQIGRPIYDRNVKAVEDQSDEMLDIINELEGNPAPKYEKPIYADATGKRPYAKNQGVSPSIENEAKRIDEWIEEQGLEDELSPVEQSIDNAPQAFTVESVNRKGGKKAYYVAANNGDAKVNIQKNKVYKTEAEAQKALKDFKNKTPGADPLQFFANGDTKGEWKIGRWRTNTAEKTGRIKNEEDLPLRNFAYRVFHESEQNEAAIERYKNSKNVAEDLMNVDRFDEVDTKAAMHEWQRLMDSGDEKLARKANWLGVKIDGEVREAGRTEQALGEFGRNTPEGQVRVAQETINDIVDKKKGVGTSEALDNIVLKLYNAYIDSNGDKDLFAKKAEELLSGTLRQHVGSKKALKMSNKAIQGKNIVLKMIDNGASVEEIADVIYKQNGFL